ncbi:hypothetical protein [Azospirillum aestuarii]|uniref:hypothetical protein n=1 Tax=Azospirillum aestuarii TaxID=2802052 RepID=UPI004054B452
MSDLLILAELPGWHDDSAAVRTVRLATEAYQDWDDPTPWWPLLLPAGGYTLAASSPEEAEGATRVEIGELLLDERPPATDPHGVPQLTELLDGMRLVGHRVPLWAIRRDRPLTERVPLAELTIGEVQKTEWTRVLRPRDRALDWASLRAAGPSKYAGTGGLEGPEAFRDKGKELLRGRHRHFEPTYLGVDPANGCHLFSASGGRPMGGYTEIRSRGRRWTPVSGTPASGQWTQDASRGLAWVGPGDVGTVTAAAAGVVDGAGAVIEDAGRVAAYVATISGAVTVAQVDAVSAAATGAGRPVALWLPAGDTTPLRQLLDDVTRSVRAEWYVGPTGTLTFAARGRPAEGEPSTGTLRAGIDFTEAVPMDKVTGIPPRRVRVRWGRNARVMTGSDVLLDVPADEKAALAVEYFEVVTPEDPTLAAACPVEQEEEADTLLSTHAAAQAEGVARLAEGWSPPSQFELPLLRLPTERIGQIVTVIDDAHPMFVSPGRRSRVTVVQVDLAGEENRLVVIPEGV